jgi:N-acetyl-gamma-glutamyl-phosphate reductase
MSIRVGIVGATGYTALEAARILVSHPGAELVVATSRSEVGQKMSDIHPSLAGRCEITITEFDAASMANSCDVAMCCLPHGASAETVHQLNGHGLRVIDYSADFRLSDLATYEKWYGVKHPWPERVGKVVYGMPEYFADEIRNADVVANPGCYPTSAILPLSPLVRAGLIQPSDIIIDSKSGVSGAGRHAKVATLYCETNESISAYSIGSHRHGPEISDLVHRISGTPIQSIFTPHLTPMDRGILSTIYVRPVGGANAQTMLDHLRSAYQSSEFVNVVDHLPATKHVVGTNYVQISARDSGDRVVLVCVIDNLSKGASGAAVQNMNVMFGLDPKTGLTG